MRFFILFAVFSFFSCNATLRLITWNIRLDTTADGVNQWPNRKDKVAGLLMKYDPDIFGVQEALHNQMSDLERLLPAFAWYGVGRDDAKMAGEYSAIFYKKEKFDLLQSSTFWLSETPEVPGSKSWDAAITRICSWIELLEKTSGEKFYFFNTHFDHIGEVARLRSMELISEKVNQIAGSSPFILMGDFNFEPSAAPYEIVNDASRRVIKDSYFSTGKNASKKTCTWTGFNVENAECRRIDYIFVQENIKVKKYMNLDDNDGTHFPSDHLPVMVEVGF